MNEIRIDINTQPLHSSHLAPQNHEQQNPEVVQRADRVGRREIDIQFDRISYRSERIATYGVKVLSTLLLVSGKMLLTDFVEVGIPFMALGALGFYASDRYLECLSNEAVNV